MIYKSIFGFLYVMKVLFRYSTISSALFLRCLYSLDSHVLYKQLWTPGSDHTSQMVNLGKQTYFQLLTSFSVCTLSAFLLGSSDAG